MRARRLGRGGGDGGVAATEEMWSVVEKTAYGAKIAETWTRFGARVRDEITKIPLKEYRDLRRRMGSSVN